ncbi:hypothetical protein SLE2022_284500 [Rubroshorea leprosula]
MELLDVGLAEVRSALAHISEKVCPPFQTALSLMEQRVQNEKFSGHLPTGLEGLDTTLCRGIPFGVLTEPVGPPGIGKTQFCLKLSLLASLPTSYGGLNGRMIHIDVESKFSSSGMIEIGITSFPGLFQQKEMAQEMAGRILVLWPTSLSEFTQSLQQIKVSLLQNQVKMLVTDSMAALVSESLAEFSRVPIIVMNQVRSQSHDQACQYSFQMHNKRETLETPATSNTHLVAALGINWAHAVTIRLVLESKSGQRFIQLAKSPLSPPLAFPFHITSSGISLLNHDGIELTGPEINSIHYQGRQDWGRNISIHMQGLGLACGSITWWARLECFSEVLLRSTITGVVISQYSF